MTASARKAAVRPTGTLGERLREHRLLARVTQEELAGLSGLSVRAISDLERGRTSRPYQRSIQLLANALKLSAPARDELVGLARAAGPPRQRAAGRRDAPAAGWPVIPRQLPADSAHFAGRAAELGRLGELLERSALATTAVTIAVIDGTAGAGKTALAVHWAHKVADLFPDGQLYLDLRGFEPSGRPMSSAAAIRALLQALQVPAAAIPPRPEARAALYRSVLAGKKMLVVLDNARSSGQVRPLMPGSPGCMVLVTSRNELADLVAEGAQLLTLDVLTREDAHALLERRIGRHRVRAEPAAADELIALCAGLPGALAVSATRAAARPRFPIAALARELRDRDDRLGLLGLLGCEDGGTGVRSAFSWSYRALGAQAARLFRLLPEHPGPDITAPAAASLAGIPPVAARHALAELSRGHLISEPIPGRFALRGLMRLYAAELGRAGDNNADRAEAAGRAIGHYLHTACAADRLLHPDEDRPAVTAQRGVWPEPIVREDQARAWFESESRVLSAIIGLAAGAGSGSHMALQRRALEVLVYRSAGRGAHEDANSGAYASTDSNAYVGADGRADRGADGAVPGVVLPISAAAGPGNAMFRAPPPRVLTRRA